MSVQQCLTSIFSNVRCITCFFVCFYVVFIHTITLYLRGNRPIRTIYNAKLHMVKVIYHSLYGLNNYVLIWGDLLSCDPLRGSHDSQPAHIWGDWLSCDSIRRSHDSQSHHIWGDWLSCDALRGSHDSQSPHIRKHLCPMLWQL